MINLIRAEVQKVVGNGLLSSLTLWVYPVGAFTFVVAVTLIGTLTPLPSESVFSVSPWDESMPELWAILTAFPGNIFARLFAISFMAAFFAGEYEWQTWKNIVPRRRRALLIVSKFLALSGVLILSMAAASLIWGAGMGVYASVVGQEYGPAINAEVLGDFLPVYLVEAAVAFGTALLLAGFCALATLLTRTIVGGLLLGLGISVVESISGPVLGWVAFVLDQPQVVNLFAYTPTYNIDNLRSWYHFDSAFVPGYIPGFDNELTLGASIVVFAVWIVGLMVLSVLVFRRQDLAS